MHYSSFPDRINVEKTFEQYFQLLPSIENQKKTAQEDGYFSTRLDDKQVDDGDGSGGTINGGKPP